MFEEQCADDVDVDDDEYEPGDTEDVALFDPATLDVVRWFNNGQWFTWDPRCIKLK